MTLGANYNSITGQLDPNGVYMTHKQAESLRYKYKQANITQKQAVEELLNEPQLKNTTFNLPTWLQENPQAQKALDTGTKKQSDWLRPTKQTELREALEKREQEIREKEIRKTKIIIEKPPPYVAINQPQEARASPRGASQQIVIETPQNYTQQKALGRIETPEPLQNSVLPEQVPEQVPESKIYNSDVQSMLDNYYKKLALIGGIAALAIVGFIIIRRMKK